MLIEARCLKCNETFNPHSLADEDLEHIQTQDGQPCGGQGEVQGSYLQPGDYADWRCQTCGGGDIHSLGCATGSGYRS